MVAFDSLVSFEVVTEVSFVDRPKEFFDPRPFLGDKVFRSSRKVFNSRTNSRLSL